MVLGVENPPVDYCQNRHKGIGGERFVLIFLRRAILQNPGGLHCHSLMGATRDFTVAQLPPTSDPQEAQAAECWLLLSAEELLSSLSLGYHLLGFGGDFLAFGTSPLCFLAQTFSVPLQAPWPSDVDSYRLLPLPGFFRIPRYRQISCALLHVTFGVK